MTARSLKGLLLRAAAVGALGAALTACGGGHGGGGGSVSTGGGGGATSTPEDFFGATFSADFHASSTSTPPVPKDGDVIPLSLTTQPQTTL